MLEGLMTNRIFLIRHGETSWNREDKLQGHSDIPLNDLGRDQATRLAPFVADLPIQRVISSDLLRARQTAELAFPWAAPLQNVDARLREVHLGKAEGALRSRLEVDFGPEMVRAWFATDTDSLRARFPEGESRLDAIARFHAALREWETRFPKENLAIVTHGLLMRSVVQDLLGAYHPALRAPNCAIFELARRGETIKMAQIYWALPENSGG